METVAADRATVEKFKEQVREEWQNPEIYAAYRKWGHHEAEWGREVGDLIVDSADLRAGQTVLDVAGGHGEPALPVAEKVGPSGHVTCTDLGPGLLDVARQRADERAITNITFRTADAHELPFPDGTFDRVTCRLGAMYFADHLQAFSEACRVLKPGGLAVYAVWADADQPLFRDVVGALFEYVDVPEDEPGAPSPFKFGAAGTITRDLTAAGFRDVTERPETVGSPFPGTPTEWWDWFVDMAPPFQALIASLREDERREAIAKILKVLDGYYDGTTVDMPIDVIVATGRRH